MQLVVDNERGWQELATMPSGSEAAAILLSQLRHEGIGAGADCAVAHRCAHQALELIAPHALLGADLDSDECVAARLLACACLALERQGRTPD